MCIRDSRNTLEVLHIDVQPPRGAPNSASGGCSSSTPVHGTTHIDVSSQCHVSMQRALQALESAAPNLNRKLRVLGLHNLGRMSLQHYMQFSRVCTCLAGSVTGLSLSFAVAAGDPSPTRRVHSLPQDAAEKKMLFTAISRLSKLTVLDIPQWKPLLGSDCSAAGALQSMRCLQSVLVDAAVWGPAFDLARVTFKSKSKGSGLETSSLHIDMP